MSEKSEIIKQLQPLIKEAREKRMFLMASYQGITFSPNELDEQHRIGKFAWGPSNWKLVNPTEFLIDEAARLSEIRRANEQLNRRIANGF